ncbi:MAG: endonuclease [Flavobacteriaceae bacterium]|nr:endonuclease [Flavobacteriaceae bacterium]
MDRKFQYALAVALTTAAIYFAEKYVDRLQEPYPDTSSVQRDHSKFDDTYLPSSTSQQVISHGTYTLSYSEEHEQAEWVAYSLLPEHISDNRFERPYFVEDRSVSTKSADWRNYKNSGYDRGHLCPAGDRRFSFDAYHETFLTSNISPQDHGFNSGIWNRLEQKVRRWAKKYNGVYVVTGGVLTENLTGIGYEGVSVPREFYKIVLAKEKDNLKAVAFLIPNASSSESYFEFAVPIDFVEAQTGIDFFPTLPEDVESPLERDLDLSFWR